METCNSALVYKAHYKSGDEWIIRLNVVSEEDGVWYTYTTYYMLKR